MITLAALCLFAPGAARYACAEPRVACGGAVMLGAAQLACSYPAEASSPQFCTFSWSLTGAEGMVSVVQGSFSVTPGTENASVYQGAGFSSALGDPVLFCQPLAPSPTRPPFR